MRINQIIRSEVGSLEQVQLALKPLKTGDNQEFSVALTSPKIPECSNETIGEVLRLIFLKLGIRASNLPDDTEKAVLLDHIRKNYPGLTISEVRLAFEMAIAGKLPVEPNCYENFSCLYVSGIMNAYKAWAVIEFKHITQPVTMIENNVELSDLTMTEWIKDFGKDLKSKNLTWEWAPVSFYHFLVKSGKIKILQPVKNDYLNRAADLRELKILADFAETKNQTEKDNFKRMRDAGVFTGNEVEKIRTICRKLVVFDWLNTHEVEKEFV